MADFARWIVAAEPALPIKRGEFLAAYQANRRDAQDLALDADPVAQAIVKMVDAVGQWTGTAGELAKRLMPEKPGKMWPVTGHMMSGAVRRVAPTLRAHGYEVAYNENARPRTWTLRKHPVESVGVDEYDESRTTDRFQACQSPVASKSANGESDEAIDRWKHDSRVDSVTPSLPSPSEPSHSYCPTCGGEGCDRCNGQHKARGPVRI